MGSRLPGGIVVAVANVVVVDGDGDVVIVVDDVALVVSNGITIIR